ncbi:MAG: hypothetical protein EBZ77_02395 [Chitinophagia bacterium]|nr:hypothetical protein [Chitinophagia bacterium]
MRRFFVKNILFVIAINVLVKPVWVFFIDRPVQNRVAGGEYGTYQALMSLGIIFQILLDFGITSYNSRTIASNPDKLARIFPSMLSARLGLMGIYITLAMGWGYLIGYRGWELTLLAGVLVMQALNSLLAFLRSNIAALHRFKTDGLLSILDRLMMIAICGFLLLYPATAHSFRIQWFVLAQVACYLVANVVAYLVLRRVSGIPLHLGVHIPRVYKIIKDSLPYALLIFLMSVYNRADAMMIERLCADGKAQADIWASAFRLLDMANILGLMFATMLLPLYGRMIAQKEDVQPIVKLCVNMLLPFSVTVALCGIGYSREIMVLLYKGATAATAQQYTMVFSWLIASFPGWCMMYIYSTLLTANGDLKLMNRIAAAGVVLNLSLNFLLIPVYKAHGGAITSFITQTGLALVFVIACKYRLKLPTHFSWLLRQALFLLCTAALLYGCAHFLPLPWVLQAAVVVAGAVALMFVFGFVSINAIRQLARQRGG